MERLYKIAKDLQMRFSEGHTPYQNVTRILEEAGEVAKEVNHFEGSGVKHLKHGEPSKKAMAKEVSQVMFNLVQLIDYYDLYDEFDAELKRCEKKADNRK